MTNAPTTRETADHAELARLAEAAKRVRRDAIGGLDGDDAHRIWFAFVDAVSNPATVLGLLSEIAALRAAGEIIAQKAENAIQQGFAHIERATQAERQRDEAFGLLRELADGRSQKNNINEYDDLSVRASTLLANQGADQ